MTKIIIISLVLAMIIVGIKIFFDWKRFNKR